MAVSENGRVIIFSAASDTKTGLMYLQKIRWVGPTTAGHTLELKTTAGDTFLAAEADADTNDQDIDMHGFTVDGIDVDTMASGTLYVYLQ